MKLKSVAGLTCYVDDTNKTAEFYEKLGFEFKMREANQVTIKLNYFWIDFISAKNETKPGFVKDANSTHKGAGVFLYLSVDDVDLAYNEIMDKGLKPSSEPKDWPWGNREFVIRDPDGYKIVIFKKK